MKLFLRPLLPLLCGWAPQREVCTELHEVFVAELFELTNEARVRRNLNALECSQALTAAAQVHSIDQARHMRHCSHTGSDGRQVSDRIKDTAYKYRRCAENVASGYLSAGSVFRALMKSRGHRRNILAKEMSDIGIAVAANGKGTLFWTQVFAQRRD